MVAAALDFKKMFAEARPLCEDGHALVLGMAEREMKCDICLGDFGEGSARTFCAQGGCTSSGPYCVDCYLKLFMLHGRPLSPLMLDGALPPWTRKRVNTTWCRETPFSGSFVAKIFFWMPVWGGRAAVGNSEELARQTAQASRVQ